MYQHNGNKCCFHINVLHMHNIFKIIYVIIYIWMKIAQAKNNILTSFYNNMVSVNEKMKAGRKLIRQTLLTVFHKIYD